MRKRVRIIAALITVLLMPVPAQAQEQETLVPPPSQDVSEQQPQAAPVYTQEQLDQMLAPIALYPDPLVAQILMASTYPLEIVEAQRWLQDPSNATLKGDQLGAALEQLPWDPSVKSMVTVPQVLQTMDTNLQWTEQLGDAFLAQQPAVMDSVQRLRQQAQAAATLKSTPQQTVSNQGEQIIIEPANPQVVYVPYYNPTVVYGTWAYPEYPPVYFPPPRGFAYDEAFIGFGLAVVILEPLWGWHHWDWGHHRIIVDDHRFAAVNHNRPTITAGVWHHDPVHRAGVPYRDPATREQFQHVSPEARRSFRGYTATAPAPAVHQNLRAPLIVQPAPPAKFGPVGLQADKQADRHTGRHAPVSSQPAAVAVAPAGPAATTHAHEALRPTMTAPVRPATVPVFESFSRGRDVRAQAARGSSSRATAVIHPAPDTPPAPKGGHPAAKPAAADHAHKDHDKH